MKKQVKVRNLTMGDGSVSIQSMTNVPVTDVEATLAQTQRLVDAGCDVVRIAVPNEQSVKAFAQVRNSVSVPLVADIHFDYRLAIGAIEAGADKIRINPGNIAESQLDKVIDAAKQNDIAIRIGVNGGSLNKQTYALFCDKATRGELDETVLDGTFSTQQTVKTLALYHSVEQYVRYFEQRGFDNLVLSVKSSNVREMIAANKFVAKLGYPMHLGVTEAGLARQGIVKNSVGIGSLLLDGIGDTIRVSLTADPVEEVYAARDLLVCLGLRKGVTFVSCPKCGRCSVDLEGVASQVYQFVSPLQSDIKVAVMGCEVNGPGECADADIGMAGANGQFVFFKQGKVYKRVDSKDAVKLFEEEVTNFVANHR